MSVANPVQAVPPVLEKVPPEVIECIAQYLPTESLKALRLTSSAVEATVRSQALSVLPLGISNSSYHESVTKLKMLASGKYRNVHHARTILIAGMWTPYSIMKTHFRRRRFFFFNTTTSSSTTLPQLQPSDGVWPSAAELDSDQPIRILEVILASLKNVNVVRFGIYSIDTISTPAWEVLISWMANSTSLSTLRIDASSHLTRLKEALPDLLEIVTRKNLSIDWKHFGSVINLLEYIEDASPVRKSSPTTGTSKVYPRLKSLGIANADRWDYGNLSCLKHLRSLDIRNHTEPMDNTGPGDSTLNALWAALAAESIHLESIIAQYSPGFCKYLQSYHSTLKMLRLYPFISSFVSFSPGWTMPPEQTRPPTVLLDYSVLSNHASTLEHLETHSARAGWVLEEDGHWTYRGSPVDSIFTYHELKHLYVPILTSTSNVKTHISSLLHDVSAKLPSLDALAFCVYFEDSPRRLSRSEMIPLASHIEQAIARFRFDYQDPQFSGPDSTRVFRRPPRVLLGQRYITDGPMINKMWQRSVNWENKKYFYRPVSKHDELAEEFRYAFGRIG